MIPTELFVDISKYIPITHLAPLTYTSKAINELFEKVGITDAVRECAILGVCSNIFMSAALTGRLHLVKYIGENDAAMFDDGRRYVTSISAYGHLDVLKYLHKKGVDISCGGAIVMASYNGHLEVVKYIIESCGDVNTRNAKSAYWWAVRNNHHTIAEYLLKNGVEP